MDERCVLPQAMTDVAVSASCDRLRLEWAAVNQSIRRGARVRKLAITAIAVLLTGCSGEVGELPAISETASDREIAEHMLGAQAAQRKTDGLARYFPAMSRDRAYAIQRLRLEEGSKNAEHVGWKLGWTRLAEPGDALDPIVGHYFDDRVFAEGAPVSTRYFTEGVSNAEPEIVFYLKEDLPGPVVTREEVIAAIDTVGIAMEFVNWRAAEPNTREHAIADNGIASGVVLGSGRFAFEEVDLAQEIGSVVVNGEQSSEGSASSIMGEDPLAALVWAANELPKWGMQLSAGDFVLSGTVCVPLPVTAGDSATVSFTSLGSVSADFVE